jgi:hypothetical protein
MLIDRVLAQHIIAKGDAREVGLTSGSSGSPENEWFVIVDRLDLQRVDHYYATDDDIDRLQGVTMSN